MNTIKVKLINFNEGRIVVNEDHYGRSECISSNKINPSINFEYNGCECSLRGKHFEDTLNDLMCQAEPVIIFDEWFDVNWSKTFMDLGLEPVSVYDPDEFKEVIVNDIDNFINNCQAIMSCEEFECKKSELIDVAMNEFNIEWI